MIISLPLNFERNLQCKELMKQLERQQNLFFSVVKNGARAKKKAQKKFDIDSILRYDEYSQRLREQTHMGKITLGGGEYSIFTSFSDDDQVSGSSIFFASEESYTPYLIIICNKHFITEYQLTSIISKNHPTELYLKLAEAILRAHRLGVVLGPDLNINNIKWDVSKDAGGFPIVTFKNLPPAPAPGDPPRGDPPRPPPKWAIPGLPDSSEATKESDIFCSPTILAQIIFKIQNSIEEALKNRDESKVVNSGSIPARNVFVRDTHELPCVVKNNGGLLSIAKKCLSSDPAARPTAEELVMRLKKLVRSDACRDVVRALGRCLTSGVQGNIFRSP